MKVLLIKNNRLYSYTLPQEVKDNFWITDIDSFDNVRNLINVEAENGEWVLVSNYDTHIVDTKNNYDRIFLTEYQFYTLKNDNECPEEENEEINMKIKPYIFGSNYSNPIYVCNFLMRIFPFTHISIELQGDLDKAERLFLSVENSFHNSLSYQSSSSHLLSMYTAYFG